jgi:hypothetical protein
VLLESEGDTKFDLWNAYSSFDMSRNAIDLNSKELFIQAETVGPMETFPVLETNDNGRMISDL